MNGAEGRGFPREGDIFRWRYTERRDNLSYWACSCIAVMREGRLCDTYWGEYASGDGRSWTYGEAVAELDLEYVANFDELVKAEEWKRDYYDDADCVNLNHPNSTKGNFYLRVGAERSPGKMLQEAAYRREKAVKDMLSAARRINEADRTINEIQHGTDLSKVLL